MPKLNGFDATRKIMELHPVPIVIVSGSTTSEEIATTFHALESGALAVVKRPLGFAHPDHAATVKELIQTVKLMSEVKVVRRWPRAPGKPSTGFHTPRLGPTKKATTPELIAIGASTGGPLVIQTILSLLPKTFPLPIVIVQHMAQGFVHGFAEWLQYSSSLPVKVASNGEALLSGHVYIAPDGLHTQVTGNRRIILREDEPENSLRPSVAALFRSAAEVYGPRAIGILLTGMGKDGAEELRFMKDRGATTIVQDLETCIVPGMPGEAVRCAAATFVFTPQKIAEALIAVVRMESAGAN
jgi:two-component system chemotaxis response regulator CheB